MNRHCGIVLCTMMMLVFWSTSQSTAQDAQQKPRIEVLTIAKTHQDSYLACVDVRLPASLHNSTTLIVAENNSVSYDKLPKPPVTSTKGKVVEVYRKSADTAAEYHYQLFLRRDSGGESLVLRIGEDRYPVEFDSIDIGPLAAKLPTEYGKFAGRFTATNESWSDETRRMIARATVRITTPDGKGTGTMVKTPEELRSLVKDNQVLVVTAAHVIPLHLRYDTVSVETFTFDSNFSATVDQTFAAEVLSTRDSRSNVDIAYLVFTPKQYRVVQVPVASKRRWLRHRQQYICIGCPGGALPRLEYTQAISAELETPRAAVYTDHQSVEGESGGGLFDPDGYLLAVRSSVDRKTATKLLGTGLVGAPEEGDGTRSLRTSTFYHTGSIGNLGESKSISGRALSEFEGAVRFLNPEDAEALRAQFREMLSRSSQFRSVERGDR